MDTLSKFKDFQVLFAEHHIFKASSKLWIFLVDLKHFQGLKKHM